jgi:cell fate (sporulation/competence/biofilm development) regulator YlbF (YheA/YmcA/DUF963 family)
MDYSEQVKEYFKKEHKLDHLLTELSASRHNNLVVSPQSSDYDDKSASLTKGDH